jgi:hypothetical protein
MYTESVTKGLLAKLALNSLQISGNDGCEEALI